MNGFSHAITAAAGIALLLAPGAAALGIDPLRTELNARPGTTLRGFIVLTNEKEHPLRLSVQLKDLTPRAQRPGHWIQIDTAAQRIPAGGTSTVAYTVSVPPDARGTLLARVGFVEQEAGRPAGVSIRTKISVPIYVTVEGTEQYRGEIEAVRCPSTRPLRVEAVVRNLGNAYLRARGECTLADAASGAVLCRFPVNEDGFPLYPGRPNRVSGASPENLGPGTYTVTVMMPFPDEHQVLSKSIEINVPGDGL